MSSTSTKIGHGLAKFFNIKLQSNEPYMDEVTRDGSVLSSGSAYATDTFVEEPVTVGEYFREVTPGGKDIMTYISSLFPFTHWISRYNWIWFAGDLVAGQWKIIPQILILESTLTREPGITIGAVVVPQGMGYAKLAELPVEFGLYSSFMGVLIYWFFATSKDITIGVSSFFPVKPGRSFWNTDSFPARRRHVYSHW